MFGLFKRKKDDQSVYVAYGAIVSQARQPEFYLSYEVPDTTVARFENIVLHVFLLLHRLKREDANKREFGQRVFDLFFADMDRSLREAGVGDVSVPKRIKKMAEAFYGRVKAYDEALDCKEGAMTLAECLGRFLYPDPPENQKMLDAFAAYVSDAVATLDKVEAEALLRGELVFPAVKAFSDET